MLREIPNIHERYQEIVDRVQGLGHKNIRPILMMQYRLDAKNDVYGIYKIMHVVGCFFMAMQAVSAIGTAVSAVAVVVQKIDPLVGTLFSLIGAAGCYASSRLIPPNIWKRVAHGEDLGVATLSGLMESFYKPILERAKKDKIPVLDLPNTLNPNDNLYTMQIEPNKHGGRLIAEGLAHIIKNHDYDNDPSVLYAKDRTNGSYVASPNPGNSGWSVR